MNDLIRRSDVLGIINKRRYHFGKSALDEAYKAVYKAPDVDAVPVVRCKDCIYFKERHVLTPDGQEKSYAEMPPEAFGSLGDISVTSSYGINVGSQCIVDCGRGYGEDKTVFREPGDFCSRGVRKEDANVAD